MSTMNLATLLVRLKADTRDYEKNLKGAERDSSRFANVAGKAIAGFAAGAFVAAAAAVAKFSRESVQEFKGFEKASAEVFTLMPGMSEQAMTSMRSDVLEFSTDVGRTTDETIPALYQAISAGVPAANVFDFMQVASDAALGGVTDLETAVDGITSVVNAYGSEAITAQEASDLLFTAVKLGKTTFGELSTSVSDVTPLASALGVEFGNVTAALAAMTSQGTSTNKATTQLRAMLQELGKEGTRVDGIFRQVAGVGFAEFMAQGGDLSVALGILEKQAEATGVPIQDMFGSVEAGLAALQLTGRGAEVFSVNLEAMEGSAGATAAAAETMSGTLEHTEGRLAATTEALKIQVGEGLTPATKAWLDLKLAVAETALEQAKQINLGQYASRIAAEYGDQIEGAGEDFRGTNEAQRDYLRLIDAIRTDSGDTIAALDRMGIAIELLESGFSGTSDELRLMIDVQESLNELLPATVYADEILTRAQYEVAEATEEVTATISEEAAILSGAFYRALNQGHESTAALRGEMSRLADTGDEEVAPALAGVAGAANITGDEVAGLMADMAEAEAAALAYEEAIRATEDALGSYFEQVLSGKSINDDLLEQFLKQAVQMGANTDELRIIAQATGNYTAEEIENAVAAANLHTEYEKLTIAYGNNKVSVEEVTEAIRLLSEGEVTTAEEALALASALSNEVPAGLGATEEAAYDAMIAVDEVTGAMEEVPEEITSTFDDANTYDIAKAELDELYEKMNRLDGRNTTSTHTTIFTQSGATGGGGAPGASGGGQGGFQHGGYTGNMGTRDVAGLVHGQEFVFSAPAVRAVGVGFLDDLHAALRRGDAPRNGGEGVNHIAFYGGQTFPNVQTGRDLLDELQNLQAGGAP